MEPDLQIVGTMVVNGKIVAAYNKAGETIYLGREWEFVDGTLRQIAPIDIGTVGVA